MLGVFLEPIAAETSQHLGIQEAVDVSFSWDISIYFGGSVFSLRHLKSGQTRYKKYMLAIH